MNSETLRECWFDEDREHGWIVYNGQVLDASREALKPLLEEPIKKFHKTVQQYVEGPPRPPPLEAWWRQRCEIDALEDRLLRKLIHEEKLARRKGMTTLPVPPARGPFEEGKQLGRLIALRESLRRLLVRRFQRVPEFVLQKIEKITDPERLQACLLQVLDLNALDELEL